MQTKKDTAGINHGKVMVFMPAYLQKGGIQARMLRKDIKLMENWLFTGRDGIQTPVSLPHTWNAADGQDGGQEKRKQTGASFFHNLSPYILCFYNHIH